MNGGACPYCDRIMSIREKVEQGACDDCAGGDFAAYKVRLQDKTVQNTKAKDRHRNSVDNSTSPRRVNDLRCGNPVEPEKRLI